jgi:hypothetical protein
MEEKDEGRERDEQTLAIGDSLCPGTETTGRSAEKESEVATSRMSY